MSIFMNRKNIKINKSNLFRLISRGIIDRRNIEKKSSNIYLNSVPYAYAKRILTICDIEVLINNNWEFVRNMDYNKLEEIYNKEDKKETDIIINREGTIEECEKEKIVESNNNDKIDENNTISEIQSVSIPSDDISEKEKYTQTETYENNAPEILLTSEEVVEQQDEEKIDLNNNQEKVENEEESIEIDDSEDDSFEETTDTNTENIQHSFQQLNLNNIKPTFRKKKKYKK